jgi:hypothetical protein
MDPSLTNPSRPHAIDARAESRADHSLPNQIGCHHQVHPPVISPSPWHEKYTAQVADRRTDQGDVSNTLHCGAADAMSAIMTEERRVEDSL